MSSVERFRATIVPYVLKRKSTNKHWTQQSRAELLEMTEAQVQKMKDQMIGLPFLYNHREPDRVGTVQNSFRHPKDGSWMIDYDVDLRLPKGRVTRDMIKHGKLRGVSLRHDPNNNRPKEVSACWEGARGPQSVTHVDPSDERHISRNLFDGSNAPNGTGFGRGSASVSYQQPDVCASAFADSDEVDDADDKSDLFFFAMSSSLPIQGDVIAGSMYEDQSIIPPEIGGIGQTAPPAQQQQKKAAAAPSPSNGAGAAAAKAAHLAQYQFKKKQQQTPGASAGAMDADSDEKQPAPSQQQQSEEKDGGDANMQDNEASAAPGEDDEAAMQATGKLFSQTKTAKEIDDIHRIVADTLAKEKAKGGNVMSTSEQQRLVEAANKQAQLSYTLGVKTEYERQQRLAVEKERDELRKKLQERDELENRTKAEEEEKERAALLQIVLDHEATFGNKNPEAAEVYRGMNLKALKTVALSAQNVRDMAEKQRQQQSSSGNRVYDLWMQKRAPVLNNRVIPPQRNQQQQQYQQKQPDTLASADQGQSSNSYEGKSYLPDNSGSFDVDAWARTGEPVERPFLKMQRPDVLASRDGGKQPMFSADYRNPYGATRGGFGSRSGEDYANTVYVRGAGSNFNMRRIQPDLRKDVLNLMQTSPYSHGMFKEGGAIDMRDLAEHYSKDFLATIQDYTRTRTRQQQTGSDLGDGSAEGHSGESYSLMA